jgi:hypothetical protein
VVLDVVVLGMGGGLFFLVGLMWRVWGVGGECGRMFG